jgi:hypothetical protein
MDPWFNARVYFIPGGLGIGDSVYLGQVLGFRTIVGETTRPYAGANRRVIYANFTADVGNNYVFYWDKQTGVLTEGTKVLGVGFTDVLVSQTNMWGPEVSWWLWIIIAIAVTLGVLSSRKSIIKKLRRKRDAQPTFTKFVLLARYLREVSFSTSSVMDSFHTIGFFIDSQHRVQLSALTWIAVQ